MNRRMVLSWLLLLLLTLLSLGTSSTSGSDGLILPAAILVVAFVKVRIIVLEFMELRHAPMVLRAVVEGWVWLTPILLIVMLGFGTRA